MGHTRNILLTTVIAVYETYWEQWLQSENALSRKHWPLSVAWGCSSVGRALCWHAANWVKLPSVTKHFPPRVNFQCRLSHSVSAAHMYNYMHQNLCVHQIFWALAATPLFGHMKILHTLVWIDRTAAAAVVVFPRHGNLNFPQGIWSIQQKNNKKKELCIGHTGNTDNNHSCALGIQGTSYQSQSELCTGHAVNTDHNNSCAQGIWGTLTIIRLVYWAYMKHWQQSVLCTGHMGNTYHNQDLCIGHTWNTDNIISPVHWAYGEHLP